MPAMRCRFPVLATALALMSCNEASGNEVTRLRPAPVTPSADAPKVVEEAGPHPADIREDPEQIAETLQRNKNKARPDDAGDYVPKEYGAGMSRWKDTGVYVDGQPRGFLTFGELPIGCKPTWDRIKTSAEKSKPSEPGWKWGRERHYRFTDYLRAIGINPGTVHELHVYGPKLTETLIATGRDLVSPAANQFWFQFGGITEGKALPHAPSGFGHGRIGDKITGIMVYIKKQPPTLTDEGLFLDGVEQLGVPYYGEPVRGGVRVYLDDKLATVIKRQDLDPKQAPTRGADGQPRWGLADFLTRHGVDISHVAELWTIQGDTRGAKFSHGELAGLTFQASSQSRGGILLGDKEVVANAIALHSRPVKPSDMPVPLQDDE
jgi:hypothetical protein